MQRFIQSARPLRRGLVSSQTRKIFSGASKTEPAQEATAEPVQEQAVPEPEVPEWEIKIQKLNDQLKESQEKTKDMQNRLLRNHADFENARKRHTRELQSSNQYAITKFAKDLLEVADNLERAAESVTPEEEGPLKTLHEGVGMTDRILKKVFQKYGIVKVDPMSQPFDPNLHEAMFEVPASEGQTPGNVMHVLNSGYKIEDRVLRAARVGVVKK